ESPRWLLTRDRREEAWATVSRLRGDIRADEGSNICACEEFYQMAQQLRVDAAAWAQGGNKQLFTKPSYWKRIRMGFFIQLQYLVYITSLYQNLQLTGGIPLILGAAYVTVATLSNFFGALILDKVG
ncbi:hypothetical protein BDY21DRAFT_290691, partial [Lineolata rhizophorae]